MTRSSSSDNADDWLTVLEAAAMLGVNVPSVVMLCEAGKLGDVVLGGDGRRRIRSSAVWARREEWDKRLKDAPSPRQAAIEAGLYDLSDEEWREVARKSREERSTRVKTSGVPFDPTAGS